MEKNHKLKQEEMIDELFDFFQDEGGQELERFFLYYRCAVMEIETKLKVLNEAYGVKKERNPIASIQSRIKRPYSIREKMKRKNKPFNFTAVEETINDVAGIRVICMFHDDVYAVAKALTDQDDITLIASKDYISNPKPNGYRSLHLIISVPIFLSEGKKDVRVEVQLRTIAMDSWAAMEHQINYKKGLDVTDEISAELKHCADLSAELDSKMNEIRKRLDPKK